ncbi:MAG: SCO family protein [Deltaproteobacteria bacterium]|nr:SCO family protein [Deltaproteobacteria bacterium]
MLVLIAAAVFAADSRPAALRDVDVVPRLDQPLPLDLELRDETGKTVRLAEFFGGPPVLLTLAYARCPMLCPMVLEGLVRSLRPLSWNVGEQFRMITVSIDPRETPEQAAARKAKLVADYGRPGAARGWHFLVGDEGAVRRLTEAVGFRYGYDAANDQYAHAAVLMALTPQGKLSRYLYGIDFTPRDVRLALVEASEGKIGTLTDRILLFCYHYDPATGKYGAAAMTGVRLAGVLTVLGIGAFVVTQIRREHRKV